MGLEIKIFQQICNLGLNIYVLPNFLETYLSYMIKMSKFCPIGLGTLLICNLGQNIGVYPNYERIYILKSSLFKEIYLWGLEFKIGALTKIFQLIWNQGTKIYVILSFEDPSLEIRKFKLLTIYGPRENFRDDLKED